MKAKRLKKIVSILVFLILLLAFFFYPVNRYVEKPGGIVDLSTLVKINNQKDKEKGSFSLTYVTFQQASCYQLLRSHFEPYWDVLSYEQVLGGSTNQESYDFLQNYYFENAQQMAVYNAFKAANEKATIQFNGLYVLDFVDGSKAKKQLKVGDIITHVNGQKLENSLTLFQVLKNEKPGNQLKLTVKRGNKTLTMDITLMKDDQNQAKLGIIIGSAIDLKTSQKVAFDAEGFGGPSAGLMFTLEIYEQLTKENIRHGQKIAGTGTMDELGNVGQIGGIDKKIVSADKAGVELFFVPKDQQKEDDNEKIAKKVAKQIHTKMKIVPVATFNEALTYLKNQK